MSALPPTQPASTPPSKEPDGDPRDKKSSSRKFSLPNKDKESQQEGMGNQLASSPLKGLQNEQTAMAEVKATSGITANASISAVSKLIQKLVTEMKVGQQNGATRAEMTLVSTQDVPDAFKNSHLTLSYENNGLTIQFDNFPSPQQANLAARLVSQNQTELHAMVQALNQKNIHVSELRIGEQTIALPRVEAPSALFSPAQVDPKQIREMQKKVPKASGPK